MGFFKSLKGKSDVGTDNPSEPTQSGQDQPQHDAWSTSQEKRRLFGRSKDGNPQSSSTTSDSRSDDQYAPPPGPPPSHHHRAPNPAAQDFFSPPPGPPPSANPPPYHDWTVVPDTALLPPPPPLPQDYSPTNNASYDSAARAHEWCARHPVYTPSRPSHELHLLANAGHIPLEPPPGPLRKTLALRHLTPTTYSVQTTKTQQDAVIISSIPLYFAAADNPLMTALPKTIYYEITIRKIANAHSGIALGFAARPYPPWRLPGWHRASIGVHGDDGRRFVNDSWGGREFVGAFRPGETVGVGMRFSTEEVRSGSGSEGRVKTRAFVTRDGQSGDEDAWEMDEERDERDEGVEGLMGEGDLYPAIGVFGGVEFDVRFGGGGAMDAGGG